MAHCVQFRGPNNAQAVLAGRDEPAATRQSIKQRVDAWVPNGSMPFGVLIARDEVQVVALLRTWAQQANLDVMVDQPANANTVSLTITVL